ncbi:hypothetical protein GCM10022207_79590 [Streptomyces lannensis]|uniref:Uncharacterized protein n=1 Tax=Streptomyces lannensis TaxID=766498 RepID=A0ABP7LDX5_9ACTN
MTGRLVVPDESRGRAGGKLARPHRAQARHTETSLAWRPVREGRPGVLERLNQAMHYIEEHLDGPIDAAELARIAVTPL